MSGNLENIADWLKDVFAARGMALTVKEFDTLIGILDSAEYWIIKEARGELADE